MSLYEPTGFYLNYIQKVHLTVVQGIYYQCDRTVNCTVENKVSPVGIKCYFEAESCLICFSIRMPRYFFGPDEVKMWGQSLCKQVGAAACF